MEHYIQAKHYDDYEVSNLGNVRNKKTGTVRKQTNRKGYRKIRINDKDVSVHRLVADSFYDGDHSNMQVNHIDGNKSNNFIGNLEWVTASENVKHAFDNKLKLPSGGIPSIKIFDETTNSTYSSTVDCVNHIGGTRQGVMYALKHKGVYKNHKLRVCEGE